MGLLIDVVKQGHGSTNDGNTARRFFASPNVTAEITGINEDLIRRFSIILVAISSGYQLDTDKFYEYAHAIMQLYLNCTAGTIYLQVFIKFLCMVQLSLKVLV